MKKQKTPQFTDWEKFFKKKNSRAKKMHDYWYSKMWKIYESGDRSQKAMRLFAQAKAKFYYYSALLGESR